METTKKSRAEPKTDRRFKPAPRANKNWTPEEDAFLQDKWGTLSIPIIAKQLGRSVGAINNRRYHLGCGAHLENDHRVSLNQLIITLYGVKNMGNVCNRAIASRRTSSTLAQSKSLPLSGC